MFAAVDTSAYDGSRKFLFIFFSKEPKSLSPTIGIMSVRSKKFLSRRFGKKIQVSSRLGGNETINIQTSIWKITKKGAKSTDPFFFKKDSRNRHILCAGMKEYATPLHFSLRTPGRIGKISSHIAMKITKTVAEHQGEGEEEEYSGSSDEEEVSVKERREEEERVRERREGDWKGDDKDVGNDGREREKSEEKGKVPLSSHLTKPLPRNVAPSLLSDSPVSLSSSPSPRSPSTSPSISTSSSPSSSLSLLPSSSTHEELFQQDEMLLHGMVRDWLCVVGGCEQSEADSLARTLLSSHLGIQCWTDLYFLDVELLQSFGISDSVTSRLVTWIEGHRTACMRDLGNIHGWLTSSLQLPPHTADKYLNLLTGEEVGITSFDDLFYLDDELLQSIGIGVIHRRKMLCWLKLNSNDERRCIMKNAKEG